MGRRKTGRAQDFDGPISIIIDSEIKEAEKKLLYYKYVLNNDYSVSYYENTDKIR